MTTSYAPVDQEDPACSRYRPLPIVYRCKTKACGAVLTGLELHQRVDSDGKVTKSICWQCARAEPCRDCGGMVKPLDSYTVYDAPTRFTAKPYCHPCYRKRTGVAL